MSRVSGIDQRYELVLEPFGRYLVWDIFEDRPGSTSGFAFIGLAKPEAELLIDLLSDDRVPNTRYPVVLTALPTVVQ